MGQHAPVDAARLHEVPRSAVLAPSPSAHDGPALFRSRHDVAEVAPRSPVRAGEGPVPEDRPMAGDGDGAPAPVAAGPADAGPVDAVPADAKPEKPAMTQSAVGITVKQKAKALSQRGSAEYKVQWSVGGKKNGWVIQHIKFQPSVQDKDGKAVAAKNTAVAYWEGWQVRDGSVYVGDTEHAHQTDTFRTISESPNTRGTILVSGKVSFVEGYKLTKPPWGNTVPEAGALPTVTAAPDGWSDAAAQDHTLTVTYDDVAKTPQEQVGNP